MIDTILKLLFGGKGFAGRKKVSADTSQKIKEKWDSDVKIALVNKKPSQLKQALITADKLLDAALKEVSKGEKMGERLKNAQNLFEWSLYDKLWKAHKVRNSMVHDLSYDPPYFVLEEAIDDFKKGLDELGISL